MEIVRAGHPDPGAFDRRSKYYDAGSDPRTRAGTRSRCDLLSKFARPVTLEMLREHAAGALKDLIVLRRGNRLSVMPVTTAEWKFIHRLAREDATKCSDRRAMRIPLACNPVNHVYTRPRINTDMEIQHGDQEEGKEEGFEEEVSPLPDGSVVG